MRQHVGQPKSPCLEELMVTCKMLQLHLPARGSCGINCYTWIDYMLLMTQQWQRQLFRTCSRWWAAHRSSSRWCEVLVFQPPGTGRPHYPPPPGAGRWAFWWRREEQLLHHSSPPLPPPPQPPHCRKTAPPLCHCHTCRDFEITACCCCCYSPFLLDHLHLLHHFFSALDFLWNYSLRFKNFICSCSCWHSVGAPERTNNQ